MNYTRMSLVFVITQKRNLIALAISPHQYLQYNVGSWFLDACVVCRAKEAWIYRLERSDGRPKKGTGESLRFFKQKNEKNANISQRIKNLPTEWMNDMLIPRSAVSNLIRNKTIIQWYRLAWMIFTDLNCSNDIFFSKFCIRYSVNTIIKYDRGTHSVTSRLLLRI